MSWYRLLFALGMLLCGAFFFNGCSGVEADKVQLSPVVPFDVEKSSRQFSKADLMKDVDQLKGIIGTTHPQADRFISSEDLEKMVEAIKSQLTDPMSEEAFYRLIAPVVAAIGCNHTYLSPSDALESVINDASSCIPIDLKIIDDKLFVIRTFGYPGIKAGDQVLGINGISTKAILQKLLDDTPTHGINETYKRATINKRLSYYFLLSFGQTAAFTLDLRHESGEQYVVTLEGIYLEDYYRRIGLFLTPKPLSFIILDSEIGYLKVSDFMVPHKDYSDFLTTSFKTLKDQGVQDLIVDLRGNAGGDPTYGAELLRYIATEPFTYFAAPYSGLEPLAREMALQENAFKGKVYVLMDGASASTTGHVLSLIQYHHIGVLIGEEAGSTFTCNDASVDKVLSVTKTKIHIARRTFETAVKDIPYDRGLMPDVLVPMTLADLVAKRDVVLDKALELAHDE